MKYTLIVLILYGCNSVSIEQIERAIELCKDNGGVHTVGGGNSVVCKNGVTIQYPTRRPQ